MFPQKEEIILIISHRFVINIKLIKCKAFIIVCGVGGGCGIRVWSVHMYVNASAEARGGHQAPCSVTLSVPLRQHFPLK